MHIFVDESGTFSSTNKTESFCVVAAYVIPESAYRPLKELLRRFKVANGFGPDAEVKRKHLAEPAYFELLTALNSIDGIAVAAVTDSSNNGNAQGHKEEQAKKFEINVPKMIHDEGKRMVQGFADDIRNLSDQEYVELLCRTLMVWDVIVLSSLYYVQRIPGALAAFRWKFDRKAMKPNHFERTFSDILDILTQPLSLEDGFVQLVGADYSKFKRFFREGEPPAWLPLPESGDPGHGMIDAGMIWRENLAFVDSKSEPGVQVADLIASGMNACLRGRFQDNDHAADLLGSLLVGRKKSQPPINLFMTEGGDEILPKDVARRVHRMRRAAKGMLTAQSIAAAG